jgi:hypothetical protein
MNQAGSSTNATNAPTRIEQSSEPGHVIAVSVVGPLDSTGAVILRQRFRDLINNRDRRFVINLGRCTGCNQEGAEALADIEGELIELGYGLILLNVPPKFETVLSQEEFDGKLQHRFADSEVAYRQAAERTWKLS